MITTIMMGMMVMATIVMAKMIVAVMVTWPAFTKAGASICSTCRLRHTERWLWQRCTFRPCIQFDSLSLIWQLWSKTSINLIQIIVSSPLTPCQDKIFLFHLQRNPWNGMTLDTLEEVLFLSIFNLELGGNTDSGFLQMIFCCFLNPKHVYSNIQGRNI